MSQISEVLGSCQTAGPIGTIFGTHLQIHLGMDIRQTNCPSRHMGGTWWVLGVKHSKALGICQMAGPIGTNFSSRLRIHLGMDIGETQVAPQYTMGHFGGGGVGVGGHKFKSLGKLSNGCTD